jgi:hypothetical protein
MRRPRFVASLLRHAMESDRPSHNAIVGEPVGHQTASSGRFRGAGRSLRPCCRHLLPLRRGPGVRGGRRLSRGSSSRGRRQARQNLIGALASAGASIDSAMRSSTPRPVPQRLAELPRLFASERDQGSGQHELDEDGQAPLFVGLQRADALGLACRPGRTVATLSLRRRPPPACSRRRSARRRAARGRRSGSPP